MATPQDYILHSFNALSPEVSQNPCNALNGAKSFFTQAPAPEEITNQTSLQQFSGNYDIDESAESGYMSFASSVGISGSYGFFSASVQTANNGEQCRSATHFGSSYTAVLNCGTAFYNRGNDQIRTHLTADFKNALDGITTLAQAAAFTGNYGTHLILGINLGGAISIKVLHESGSYSEKNSVSTDVKAAYSGIGSMSMTANAAYGLSTKYSSLQQTIFAAGGSAATAAQIDPKQPATINDWARTCTIETVYGISNSLEIWRLATNVTAQNTLRRYINLLILAKSIQNPTIFTANRTLIPGTLTTVTAVTPQEDVHYRIIGGGASVPRGSSSFLSGSYPVWGGTSNIPGWVASSHDSGYFPLDTDNITSYAIAIYDPEYDGVNQGLLAINVVSKQGTNGQSGPDYMWAPLPAGFILSGGGCFCWPHEDSLAKFIVTSYPDVATHTGWISQMCDYVDPANNTTQYGYAVGIQCADLVITPFYSKSEIVFTQYGTAVATLGGGTSIAGGGVCVWGSTGDGNLVQQTYPSSDNSWQEYNTDARGRVSPADSQAFAISFLATVRL